MNGHNSSSDFDFTQNDRRLANPYKSIIAFATILSITTSLCTNVLAEEPSPTVLEPIVVSASHIPSALDKTSASTTIISREEVEARQAISAVDLLRQVSGLHIDQPGGRGGISSVYIRGSDPNFTVVLIDGIKVNDPTNNRGGSFDFSTLDPASIERIEIVRGPLSSVYGSDAMGGVINIITRQGSANQTTSVHLSGGSDDYRRAGFETRGPLGAVDVAFNLSYVDDGSPVEGSQFIGKNFSGKLTYAPSNTQWLELVSRYGDSESESFPDDSGGPEFAVIRTVDQREAEEWTVGSAYGHNLVEGLEYTLKISYYNRKEGVVSPGVAPGMRNPFGIPPNRSDNRFDRTNFVINAILFPSSSARLSIVTEIQLENGESDGTLLFGSTSVPNSFALDRKIYSAFLEAEWVTPLGLILEGGARLDDPEGLGPEVSPRVGLIYRMDTTQTTLKADWGEGFKLPSFFALGNAIVGNAALVPETGRSFEIGIAKDFLSKRMQLSGTFFHNRFFNLIDFDEKLFKLVNRLEVTTEGIELTFGVQATNKVSINSHATYTKTDIKETDEALRNRPEWRGGVNARWQIKKDILSNLNILYVGQSLDSSIATGDSNLDDSIRVDVATTWKLPENWELSIAIDNIFDVNYEEAVGFPATGIRGRIVVRFVISDD